MVTTTVTKEADKLLRVAGFHRLRPLPSTILPAFVVVSSRAEVEYAQTEET